MKKEDCSITQTIQKSSKPNFTYPVFPKKCSISTYFHTPKSDKNPISMGKTLLIEDPIPHIVIPYPFPIVVPHLYSPLPHTSVGHEDEGYPLLPQPPQRLRSTGHGGGAARHHAVDVQHHSRATEAA